ncbi:protein PLANT CADMIUM RESISTANCE 11 [Benincasa hispida]|uniref:protein PLANT CADMIUM RESISTANCE 11 n=1 Tax=Benincasa hispida TaxID=102211 RepID=UPI001900EE55|nr:protein PLANT CADMIUM RESISTANCE 11 [Benincasa hispida]
MADLEKQDRVVVGNGFLGDEEEKLLDGVTLLDFDMLCSTVAMQTQGKWAKLETTEDAATGPEFGGVFRMWEGELLDCYDDRRIAIESACCPCHRFGKNMGRAGFGSCFLQGTVYLILVLGALCNFIAFLVSKRHYFLYSAIAFTISTVTYLGFFRTQMRRKFNIRGGDNSLDDCIYHLICPCCALSQESRTLEMNNVQDGTWHGRGDTICIGSYGDASRIVELNPPPPVSTKMPEPCGILKDVANHNHS